MKSRILIICILFFSGFIYAVEDSSEKDVNLISETKEEGDGKTETDLNVKALSLEECIELAIKKNRELIGEEENFILQQLSYELVKHNYGPLLSSTIRTDVDKSGLATQKVEASVTQRLLTGGDIGLTAAANGTNGKGAETDSYDSVIALKYVQPLLKDAGYTASREDLTSAENGLKYAERSLILYKQEFLVGIIRQYCRLLQQKKTIKNQEQKVENAKFLLERSKAQMDRGKASPIDVYRAELALLEAENVLIDSKDAYQLSLDEFKFDIGIPIEEEMQIQERELHYASYETNLDEYIQSALTNRLDLKTANDMAEDSKRRLDIARNRLRSRLDFDLSLQTQAGPANTFKEQDFGEGEWVVGLEYEIPLDRTQEKNDYREQLIQYLQQMRSREALRDRIISEVRTVLRELRKAESTMKIQERNIEIAEKQLERAKEDYDRGTITNRDYVDALNDLTDSQNSFDEAVVDYVIASLESLRITGKLEFEKWKDLIK